MGVDDLFSTESAFVAAATAAVFSPKTRGVLRRGAVLGVAGVMKAGDVVAGAARGATRGIRGEEQAPAPTGTSVTPVEPSAASAKTPKSRAASRPGRASASPATPSGSGSSAAPPATGGTAAAQGNP